MTAAVRCLALATALTLGLARLCAQEGAATKAPPDDGWFDLSGFLKEKYGFLPIVMPITEPAIGYGVAGGLAFLSKPLGEARAGFGRPDITMVGGMATENDSKAGAFGDIRYWLEDRLQTRVFVVDGSVNLDFHGLGDDAALSQQPLSYNLEPLGTSLEARYRLEDSPWWVGLNYSFAQVGVSFDAPANAPGLPAPSDQSEVGGLVPSLTFDSRDNMFTPTSGSYLEATVGLFSDALGGDEEFQRLYVLGMQYAPLAPRL